MPFYIGNEAIDRNNFLTYNYTYVDKNNPSVITGIITSIEIWANIAMTGCKVAIFVASGNSLSTRNIEAIGDVTVGYNKFNVNLNVVTGDYIGIYFTAGGIDCDIFTDIGETWYLQHDWIPCTDKIFFPTTNRIMSLYGIGDILTLVTNEVTGINRVDPSKVNANGNITLTGGTEVTKRGFKYGLTGTEEDIGDVNEEGSFGAGTYSLEIIGLDPDIIYYVRAYADNVNGRSCGSYIQFKTAVPYWSNKIEIKAEAIASDADIAKVGGKKTLTINNHLIQNMSIAQNIAKAYLAEYKDQKIASIIDRPIPLPYEIGDTIQQSEERIPILPYRLAAVAGIEYKLAIEAEHYYKSLGRYLMIRKINLRFSAGNYISTLELEG